METVEGSVETGWVTEVGGGVRMGTPASMAAGARAAVSMRVISRSLLTCSLFLSLSVSLSCFD